MKFKNFICRQNSKTQKAKKKNSRPIRYIACNKCHEIGKTLVKGRDSYYCIDCFNKLKNMEE